MFGMFRSSVGLISMSAIVVGCAMWLAPETAKSQSRSAALSGFAMKLRARRTSATDLEVGGELTAVPPGAARYIRREDLMTLPQVIYMATDDSNFPRPSEIKGVRLEDLVLAVGAAPTADLVVALCDDKYRANYPHAYLEHHHPVLVLEVGGKTPSGWPKNSLGHGYDMGPYMISQAKFTPSFQILSYQEEPQIPWGVVRLEFRSENAVFGAIAPRGPQANDSAVQAGYKIAQQNCFRCHNMASEGGQKSGVPWAALSAFATGSPAFFLDYVRDPAAKNPKSQMPGSPQYDDATMHALLAYFQTFTPPEKP